MSVLTAPVERADTGSAVGSVIAVDQIPVTSVRSFTLRTEHLGSQAMPAYSRGCRCRARVLHDLRAQAPPPSK